MANNKTLPENILPLFIDLHLPRARERLSEKILEMQTQLSYVANDISRHGISTKLNPLANILVEIHTLHEKVALLTEVQKLTQPGV
jgi:uncharacterized protein (UPF0216 family)